MARTLRVHDWHQFQHYKDRSPSWIKLHKELLDSFKFHRLPVDSRALAPMIWLLASESNDGTVDYDLEKIGFRLRMSSLEVEAALIPLISGGFLELCQDDSAPLAEPGRAAIPETEDIEKKEEEEDTAPQADADLVKRETISIGDDVSKALEAWNRLADECGLARVQVFNASRRKKVGKRLRDCGGLEVWNAGLDKIRGSPFLRGQRNDFRASFDFFLKPSNFTKIIEGNYDGKPTGPGNPTGNGVTDVALELIASLPDEATVQ